MTWAASFNGVDGYASLGSDVTLSVGDTLTIRAKANDGNSDSTYRLLGRDDSWTSLIELQPSRINIRLGNTSNNYVSSGYILPSVDVWFEVELERLTNTDYEVRLDGVVLGVIYKEGGNNLTFNSLGGFNKVGLFAGEIEYVKNGLANNWDATASDHNSGSDPVTNPFILTDTVGGNNATGVNMTTANWIDLGGSGITLTATEVLSSFADSVSVNVEHNITATVTETLNSFLDSSAVLVSSAEEITATVTESFNSFIDSSSVNVSANIGVEVTEALNSFLDGSNVIIAREISVEVTEVLASFVDRSFIKVPTSWIDKGPVTTSYTEKTPTSTTYTTKQAVNTIWTDKG